MPDQFERAYIGLGSNLQNPPAQLEQALVALGKLPQTQLVCVSSFYRSAPLGPPGQPDYCNAVASLDTRLTALELLNALQAIEQAQGRLRSEHWGARTLDLDILLFAAQSIHTARLVVPHPEMQKRAFVLWPLSEIAPNLSLPNGQPLTDWLIQCPYGELEKLDIPSPACRRGVTVDFKPT